MSSAIKDFFIECCLPSLVIFHQILPSIKSPTNISDNNSGNIQRYILSKILSEVHNDAQLSQLSKALYEELGTTNSKHP